MASTESNEGQKLKNVENHLGDKSPINWGFLEDGNHGRDVSNTGRLSSCLNKQHSVAGSSKPARHHTARAASPHHDVLPRLGGEVGPQLVVQVGRCPGGELGEADQERWQQNWQQEQQKWKQERKAAEKPTTDHTDQQQTNHGLL